MKAGLVLHPCLIVSAATSVLAVNGILKEGAFIAFHGQCMAETINHIENLGILGNKEATKLVGELSRCLVASEEKSNARKSPRTRARIWTVHWWPIAFRIIGCVCSTVVPSQLDNMLFRVLHVTDSHICQHASRMWAPQPSDGLSRCDWWVRKRV
ncbi:hypothetical protein VNO77_17357 [Canavalia gladiata]|uniref:Secreted protein n=1 Tax=Canavalia gladiata TaxID=3824 RepID=A0AAN9LIX4_CANGL